MDKVKKLKRYQRKDYSQLVSFPVEIVGRDGVVRRYSFESSVRLYQRRIASSRLRYHDPEVAEAEASHCQSRIRQLRLSFCASYGWEGVDQAVHGGEFAGEVVAFILRVLRGESKKLSMSALEGAGNCDTWALQRSGSEGLLLLYLFRFDGNGPSEEREAFFALLRSLQLAKGDQVERMVAFHHTADCALVLTGAGVEVDRLVEAQGPPAVDLHDMYGAGIEVSHRDPFQRGIRCLSVGDAESALVQFEHAIANAPYRKKAHSCVIALTDFLDRPAETEIAVRVALHHFPDCPELLFMDAVARYKQGKWGEGAECLRRAAAAGADPARVHALGLRIALGRGARNQACSMVLKSVGQGELKGSDLGLSTPGLSRLILVERAAWALQVLALVCAACVALTAPVVSLFGVGLSVCLGALRRWGFFRLEKAHCEMSRRYIGPGLPENLLLEGDAVKSR